MDCDDCIDRLYQFLDLELTETEVVQVRAHLSGCDDCGEEFGLEETFLRRLRDCVTSDVAPRELRERVVAKLKGGSSPAS